MCPRKTIILLMSLFLVALTAARSSADSPIRLKSSVEVEKESLTPDGRKVLQRGPAYQVVLGQEIVYATAYENIGKEAAENVVITNPIPEGMVYKDGSAKGAGTRITFSIDGGHTFDAPSNLFIKDMAGRVFPARAQDYTHIRWKFDKPLPPGARGEVSFRAILRSFQ